MNHKRLTVTLLTILLAGGLAVPALAAPLPQVGGGISNALVAWWKLDESDGQARQDSYTNNLDLTDHNTVVSPFGVGRRAASFTAASSQYLSHAAGALFSPEDSDLTFSLWVQLSSKAADMGILGKVGNAASREYSLYYDAAADNFIWEIYDSDGDVVGTAEATLFSPLVDTWYFVVVSHDAANDLVSIEIDGTYVGQGATTGTMTAAANQFEIGRNGALADYLDGMVDEVGFWNRLLTASEKTQLYNDHYGATLDIVEYDLAYLYTEYLSMAAGLPDGWQDICAQPPLVGYQYSGLSTEFYNDDWWEQSGSPSWGQKVTTEIGQVCNSGAYAITVIQREWEGRSVELQYTRFAYMSGDNEAHSRPGYVQIDDTGTGTYVDDYYGPGSYYDSWEATSQYENTEVWGVRFGIWDGTNTVGNDHAYIDDITLQVLCYDYPCHSAPIPITELDYHDTACYAGEDNCPNYTWLTTEPDAYVYSAQAGTVAATTQNSAGFYTVLLEDANGDQWEYTQLSSIYVGYGATVEIGCLIGQVETVPAVVLAGGLEALPSYGLMGWAKVEAGVYSDPTPLVWHYAIAGQWCGQGYASEVCNLNNPYFIGGAEGWSYTPEGIDYMARVVPFAGNPHFSGGVVMEEAASYLKHLLPEPELWQQVILDPGSSYVVTVIAQQSDWFVARVVENLTPGQLKVTLGDSTPEVASLNGTSLSILEFGPITPVPDGAGNLTTVKLVNDGYDEVTVYHVCVSNTSLAVGPGNCFFDEWQFPDSSVDPPWTYTPGTGSEPNPPWYGIPSTTLDMPTWIELVEDDTLSQNKTLYPEDGGGAFTYRLKVRATAHNASSSAGDYATLNATFGTYDQDFTIDYDDLQTTAAQEDTFSIDTASVTDDFTFSVTALAGGVDAVHLEYVCLLPDSAGGMPGYEDAIPNPGEDDTACITCRPPDSLLAIGEWVKFLACVVKNLFHCYLAGVLDRIITLVKDVAKISYQLGAWWGNVVKIAFGWIKPLVYKALGILSKFLAGLINALLEMEWLKSLLKGAYVTANSIPRTIGVLTKVVVVMGKALGLAGSVLKALDRMIDATAIAINSATTASMTVPNCADPEDPLYAICQGMDLVESRLPMAAVNLLGMGAMGIWLTFWTLGKFHDTGKG